MQTNTHTYNDTYIHNLQKGVPQQGIFVEVKIIEEKQENETNEWVDSANQPD